MQIKGEIIENKFDFLDLIKIIALIMGCIIGIPVGIYLGRVLPDAILKCREKILRRRRRRHLI